jgi:hypothetical protein
MWEEAVHQDNAEPRLFSINHRITGRWQGVHSTEGHCKRMDQPKHYRSCSDCGQGTSTVITHYERGCVPRCSPHPSRQAHRVGGFPRNTPNEAVPNIRVALACSLSQRSVRLVGIGSRKDPRNAGRCPVPLGNQIRSFPRPPRTLDHARVGTEQKSQEPCVG